MNAWRDHGSTDIAEFIQPVYSPGTICARHAPTAHPIASAAMSFENTSGLWGAADSTSRQEDTTQQKGQSEAIKKRIMPKNIDTVAAQTFDPWGSPALP